MSAQHTPWKYRLAGQHSYQIIGAADKSVLGESVIVNNVSYEANARLIAAAPELLDALVAIVNAWEHGAEFGSNEIGDARKAIAKAEGKQ
jgi:hypothetical protein